MSIQVFKPKYRIKEVLNEIEECLEIGWTDKFGIYAGYTPAQRHEYRKLFKLPSKPREARKMLRILAYKAL
jgi:hypothetical protein